MRVIIAGSRHISDYDTVVNAIIASGWADKITEVVCGASEEDVRRVKQKRKKPNVDILGALWAEARGIPVRYFPAAWHKEGLSAGPRRNHGMAEYAAPDGALILVWDGRSKGSKSMLGFAKQYNLKRYPVVVTESK